MGRLWPPLAKKKCNPLFNVVPSVGLLFWPLSMIHILDKYKVIQLNIVLQHDSVAKTMTMTTIWWDMFTHISTRTCLCLVNFLTLELPLSKPMCYKLSYPGLMQFMSKLIAVKQIHFCKQIFVWKHTLDWIPIFNCRHCNHRRQIYSSCLFMLLLLLLLLFFLLLLFLFLCLFLSNFFSMISCGSTLTLEIIPLASRGLVVRGPTWLTLSRRFSHDIRRRDITVPRVSKP